MKSKKDATTQVEVALTDGEASGGNKRAKRKRDICL